LELLKQYGFIKDFEIIKEEKKAFIKIFLNLVENPVNDIPEVKFYSKPSRPWYISYKEIKTVAGGK
jgi:ribosomal protein S8